MRREESAGPKEEAGAPEPERTELADSPIIRQIIATCKGRVPPRGLLSATLTIVSPPKLRSPRPHRFLLPEKLQIPTIGCEPRVGPRFNCSGQDASNSFSSQNVAQTRRLVPRSNPQNHQCGFVGDCECTTVQAHTCRDVPLHPGQLQRPYECVHL
jgi:hypothetical protein